MSLPLSTPPTITLLNSGPNEQHTRSMLLGLFAQYPLDKWRYTDHIQIEDRRNSYSHPILTISTRLIDEDDLLAAYIHEQLHWFLVLKSKFELAKQAAETFQQHYPHLPLTLPEGCGSSFSNYLHIKVLYLEYAALIELLGAEKARAVFARAPIYTKIVELVLTEFDAIGAVMRRHGLIVPNVPEKPRVFIDITPSGSQSSRT
jgi:hypothetical protein